MDASTVDRERGGGEERNGHAVRMLNALGSVVRRSTCAGIMHIFIGKNRDKQVEEEQREKRYHDVMISPK